MIGHSSTRRALLAVLLIASSAFAQRPAETAIVKGVVVDLQGAVVPKAHIRIIGSNGELADETFTDSNGRFELVSPTVPVTLIAEASGFDRFQKPLDLAQQSNEVLEVKLSIGCLPTIEQIIPKKPDLRQFLVEIHHKGSFGDCPERIYRLWGTGEASISYEGCGGKTFQENRLVKPNALATALAELASKYPGPACSYYPGGIDAPSVEFTIITRSEPRVVISHDEGEMIESVTRVEEELEKLIDPESHMQSFHAGKRPK